jgi:uncharacterized protein DUF2510
MVSHAKSGQVTVRSPSGGSLEGDAMNDQRTPPPAGWFADPSGEFQLRYWDGLRWTRHVSSDGAVATDPHFGDSSPVLADGGDASNSPSTPEEAHPEKQGFFARRRAAQEHRSEGRDAFESLALHAAAGDHDALVALPAAVSEARALYKPEKFEKKRLEILGTAVREVITDDILDEDEEAHLAALLDALDVTTDALRQRDLELFEELVIARINDGRPPTLGQVELLLKRGEVANAVFAPVSLMKERAVRQYRGGSSGVSIPIGFGVRYRTSSSRGRSVVVGTELVEEDRGQLTITSVRSVFVGARKTLEFRHDKLVGLEQFRDGLRLNVSNRQTASLLKMPRTTSPSIAAALISWQASRS